MHDTWWQCDPGINTKFLLNEVCGDQILSMVYIRILLSQPVTLLCLIMFLNELAQMIAKNNNEVSRAKIMLIF